MKFSEMLELAKAGYSLSDIKEMNELEKAEKDQPKDEPNPAPKDEPKPQPKDEPNPAPKDEPKPQPKDEPKDEPKDYKKLYEESQALIKSLQAQNVNKDMGKDAPKDDDILADLVRNYM